MEYKLLNTGYSCLRLYNHQQNYSSSYITIQINGVNITLSNILYNTTEYFIADLSNLVTIGGTVNFTFNNTIGFENFSGNGNYFSVIITIQNQLDVIAEPCA